MLPAHSNEVWAPVAGFPAYEVSTEGNVRNAVRGSVLKPYPFSNGYLGVQLGKTDGRRNVKLVHRLVAQAFVPGDIELQVNHKDGRRANNAAGNLEWVTCSDNHRHSYRTLARKRHGLSLPVVVGGTFAFDDMSEAARFLGVVPGSVASALRRSHKCVGLEVAHA